MPSDIVIWVALCALLLALGIGFAIKLVKIIREGKK